jgi:proteasome accessory factor C
LSKEEDTVREVEPWTVFTTLGNWYLQGHCRLAKAERNFRVDRIRDLEILDESFARPDRVPEPGVGYTPTDDDVVSEIWLSPGASWVPDYYPVEVLHQDDEGLHIRFSSIDAELPARLLLRLGGSARLIAGVEVADRVKKIGNDLLARYR